VPRKKLHTAEGLEVRKCPQTGRYRVPVPIAGTNRRRWVSTGCRSLAEASAVIAESGVNRLVHLANAKAVTQAAIQIITQGKTVSCMEILGSLTIDAAGRWADSTTLIYRTQIMAFFRWAKCERRPLVDVTREQLLNWVNHGEAKMATRSARMTAVRILYRYAIARNFVLENPAETAFIEKRKMSHEELEPREVLPFTEEEFRKIVDSPATTQFWRVVTTVAYWTGLRFVDCLALEWDSLEPDRLIVWTRKRGARVALPLNDPILGAGEVTKALESLPTDDPVYCFPEERAAYLNGRRSQFPTAFAVLMGRLGIEGKSFHSTRHAAATRMKLAGKTLEDIGEVLGHGDTATTEGYVHTDA
jgi:integrase